MFAPTPQLQGERNSLAVSIRRRACLCFVVSGAAFSSSHRRTRAFKSEGAGAPSHAAGGSALLCCHFSSGMLRASRAAERFRCVRRCTIHTFCTTGIVTIGLPEHCWGFGRKSSTAPKKWQVFFSQIPCHQRASEPIRRRWSQAPPGSISSVSRSSWFSKTKNIGASRRPSCTQAVLPRLPRRVTPERALLL